MRFVFTVHSDKGTTGGMSVVVRLLNSVVKVTGSCVFWSSPSFSAWLLDNRMLALLSQKGVKDLVGLLFSNRKNHRKPEDNFVNIPAVFILGSNWLPINAGI